jgi:plasmid segregation protein ParM
MYGVFVGQDIGYGQSKLSCVSRLTPAFAEIHPSGAAPIAHCDRVASGHAAANALGYGEEVLINGETYVSLIDPDRISSGMQVLHEDYPSTPEYMALYYGALARTREPIIDHLVTGLPVAQCRDREKAVKLKNRLEGQHEIRKGRVVTVKKVTIVPQAIGAYYAALDSGQVDARSRDNMLVLDFGHYSVDWVLIAAGNFRLALSGSNSQGGSYVIDRMVANIKERHGIVVSRERVYGFVREGLREVQLGREKIDLDALKELAAAQVAPAVIGDIRASLRGDQSLGIHRLMLCGGSTPFFAKAISEAFPQALVDTCESPVLANAIGFRVYAKRFAS